MQYNGIAQTNRIPRRFVLTNAVDSSISQSHSIVGKAPSMCGLTSSAVRLSNDSTCGGRFAMGKGKSERKKERRICKFCGMEFDAWAARNKQTCSNNCHKLLKVREQKGFSKICVTCGKEFIPEHFGHKTCSDSCRDLWNRNVHQRNSKKNCDCLI